MGALANPTPLKLNQYGRDPKSPVERMRLRDKGPGKPGFMITRLAMLADMPRLMRGASCWALVSMILAHQDETNHEGWTKPMSLAEWANLTGCDEKEVQRNRDYLKLRKMADVRVDTKREFSFRLRPETWEALENYSTWKDKQKPEAASTEEAPVEDPGTPESKKGNWRMSKPVAIKAGSISKPFTPDCGVAKFRVQVENLDASMFSMVQGGTLTVRITGATSSPIVPRDEKAKKNENKGTSEVRRGHVGGREVGNPAKVNSKALPARGGELIAIFDPFLEKSGSRLLSFSQSFMTLQLSCEAIGETPRDFLLHCLNKPGGRGSRPIQIRGIVGICEDAREAWEKERKNPRISKAEIDRLAEEDLRKLAAQRAARGRK